MKYEEIEGDLIALALEGKFDVIGHGCNCHCAMKRGIAPQMAAAFGCDKFFLEDIMSRGEINKLGMIDYQRLSTPGTNGNLYNELVVVNMYTQFHWSSAEHPKPFDYAAFELCIKKLAHLFKGQHIGLPMIGAGLAGGVWARIQHLIIVELVPHCDVTIVKLPK